MSAIIEVRNLGIRFQTDTGTVNAVDGVDFSLHRGETLALVGESGSGKSLTGRALMRLLPNTAEVDAASRIRLHDGQQWRDVFGLRGAGLKLVRGGRVSMVFQEPMASFAPAIRIGDQIVESIQLHQRVNRSEARARVLSMFERVGIPQPELRFQQYAFELSGGLRQRAMIAAALVNGPDVLIADEPTTALDVTIQAQILDLLKALQQETGIAVLFITHDLGVVWHVADRVLVMNQGRLVETGPTQTVFARPEHAYTRRLLAAVPDFGRFRTPVPGRQTLTEVRNLRVTFDTGKRWLRRPSTVAVDTMDLSIQRGEILGLVGESGSGKTTLGKALLGAVPFQSGVIRHAFRNHALALNPGERRPRVLSCHAQMIFQDPYGSLNPRMTIRDIIAEPLEAMSLCRGKAEVDRRVVAMAEQCGIEPAFLRRFPHAFSGGQRQRIGIARALIAEPELVVADEAVAALDVSIQAQILELLASLQASMGLTLVFISHDLSVISALCDRVVVMRHGRLIESGPCRQVFETPESEYTRELISAVPRLPERDDVRLD